MMIFCCHCNEEVRFPGFERIVSIKVGPALVAATLNSEAFAEFSIKKH